MVVRLTEDCKGVADIAVAEIITPLARPLRDTCPSRALQSPIGLSGANGVRLLAHRQQANEFIFQESFNSHLCDSSLEIYTVL